MRTTKILVRATAITATAIGAAAVIAPDNPLGRGARRLSRRLARDVRYAVAAAPGVLDVAQHAGARQPESAVHAVLCGFGDRVPYNELVQLAEHLPTDVRALMTGPHRHGDEIVRLRSVPQLVAAVVAEGGIDPYAADAATRAVLAELRTLVPEEAQDVSAVLPAALREVWEATPAR